MEYGKIAYNEAGIRFVPSLRAKLDPQFER
jgi:hypothetical protein